MTTPEHAGSILGHPDAPWGASRAISFRVPGLAAPQGSKTRTRYGMREDNPRTRPWRATVTAYALEHRNGQPTIHSPVFLELVFDMPRPKGHYRTGKHAGELKPDAPAFCATKPDASKLARAIEDALVDAALIRDDSLVVRLSVTKLYADEGGGSGVTITVRAADAPSATTTSPTSERSAPA